jgi:hypothetical protein
MNMSDLNNGVFFHPSYLYKPSQLIKAGPQLTWFAKKASHLEKKFPYISRVAHSLDRLILRILSIFNSFASMIFKTALKPVSFNQVVFFPPPNPIEIKKPLCAFNHVQEFAIKNEILWTRLRGIQQKWEEIKLDGAPKAIPVALSCDGANLIVLDQDRNVHYKKVLGEVRTKDINDAMRHKLTGQAIDNQFNYITIDKATRQNWKKTWFSLPYIHRLVNLFTGKRLTIPPNARAWAISHRGKYNNYLEDKIGNQHPAFTGVTTLYILTASGKDLLKYDPWSPKHIEISIPLPETATTIFEAENVSVSASMVMVIGYEVSRDQPDKKTLCIQTRLADIDSEGWNPGLKYAYFENPKDPEVQVIPLAHWEKHPIVLEEGDRLTKNITIFQTGEGNQARELRIEGIHQNRIGFFFKKIDEKEWHFEPHHEAHQSFDHEDVIPLVQDNQVPFQSTVHNYQGEQIRFKQKPKENIQGSLKKFGLRSFHSRIQLSLDSESIDLDLYKRKTWKNFAGFKGEIYQLVIPENYHKRLDIMRLFKNKKVISLTVSQKNEQLTLRSSSAGLHWTFKKQE